MPEINWYPGHMAKAKRLLSGQLKLIDAVIELCDARAPLSTRNPDLLYMSRGKAHILVLNKADLASERETKQWLAYFKAHGETAVALNATGGGTREILSKIEQAVKPGVDRMKARGVMKTARLMVVGIPNVGKSTFINRLRGSAVAKTADRPGVTRASTMIKVGPYLELLDTPGMLWPKLSDQRGAKILAYLGSISDQIMDAEKLAGNLLHLLMTIDPAVVSARFKLPEGAAQLNPEELLHAACAGRGWLMSGGRPDETRGAALVLDEYRAGKAGRITLESAPKAEKPAGSDLKIPPEASHGEGDLRGEATPNDGD
jgi:ribosome biogenesis GTPase A